MEILYQSCLTAAIALLGLILWACASVWSHTSFKWFFQSLAVVLAIFLIIKYVWIGFTLREIATFVLYNVVGWGIFLGIGYIVMVFVLAYGQYKKALKDIETLKEQNLWTGRAILDLEKSVEKLGAPVPKKKIKIY